VQVEDLGEDPYELLRERWGGGEYLITTRDNSGAYMPGNRVRYHLAGPPKDPLAVEKDEKDAEMEKRLEKLADGGGNDSRVMVELIRQNNRPPPPPPAVPPPVDHAPLITAIGTMLGPVLAALVKRPDPPEPPPPPPSALEQIEMLGAMMTLAREMNPPQDGIAGLAKTMGEPIAKLVDAHLSGQTAAPGPGAPQPTPEAGVPRPPWYPFLAPIVPQALKWAAAGKDPELRGDLIVDELRDDQVGQVYRVLANDSFRGEFFHTFPEAVEHQEWFDILFRRIAGGIVPPEELEAAEKLEREQTETPELEAGGEAPVAEGGAPGEVEGADAHSLG
jgi:hypothetical protein